MEEERKISEEDILINWEFPEFDKHERSKKWYIVAIIVLAVLLIYSVWVQNILFAIILVLAVFVSIIQHFQEPNIVDAAITDDGVMIGSKFYEYEQLEGFWIIYKPPLAKLLYIDFKNKFKRSLHIPLEKVDPNKVREILGQYLEEDLEKEEEHLGERMAKVLKM